MATERKIVGETSVRASKSWLPSYHLGPGGVWRVRPAKSGKKTHTQDYGRSAALFFVVGVLGGGGGGGKGGGEEFFVVFLLFFKTEKTGGEDGVL